MRVISLLAIALMTTSCAHEYWEYKQEKDLLKMKHTHLETMQDKCVEICGHGNVSECIASSGKTKCYQEK